MPIWQRGNSVTKPEERVRQRRASQFDMDSPARAELIREHSDEYRAFHVPCVTSPSKILTKEKVGVKNEKKEKQVHNPSKAE